MIWDNIKPITRKELEWVLIRIDGVDNIHPIQ